METLAIAALGSAGTAATATAAATAGTAGLFGSAGAFSFMQTASTLGTAFSIGSTLMGGAADQAAAKSQARFEAFRAKQEQTRGRLEGAKIKDDLARSLSTSIAVGAAQGIDISSGSPARARNAAVTDANRAWSISKYNADMGAEAYRNNAYVMRQRGKNAFRSARASAAGLASDFMSKQYDRGMTF
jgi:hypothetical protein